MKASKVILSAGGGGITSISNTNWPAGDLCGRIFRRVEARRTRHQGSALDERSDERVRTGEDRIDQRVRNRLIDKLQHRELHRLLDYVHRAAHRDEIVRRGCGRVRRASVSPHPKPVPNALNTVTIPAAFRLLVSDDASRIDA